jgi:hypothetical protein
MRRYGPYNNIGILEDFKEYIFLRYGPYHMKILKENMLLQKIKYDNIDAPEHFQSV